MILIVGGTGRLGSAVTKKLAAAGKPVTAPVRDPASEKARALGVQPSSLEEWVGRAFAPQGKGSDSSRRT